MGLFKFGITLLFIAGQTSALIPSTYNVLITRTSPTSIDGNCGSNSDTNSTCLTSTWGNCCSSKGFCGSTSAYCGAGCQSDFGTCTTTAGSQSISTSGSCGATSTANITCLGSTFGDCCSPLGYCGGTSDYCGDGCKAGFGKCGESSETVSSSSSAASSSPSASSSSLVTPSSTPSSLPLGTSNSTNGTNTNSTTPSHQEFLSAGAKAGIAVGVSVAAILAGVLAWYVLIERRRRRHPKLPVLELDADPFSRGGQGRGQPQAPETRSISQELFVPPVELGVYKNNPHAVELSAVSQAWDMHMDDGLGEKQRNELAGEGVAARREGS